MIYGGINIIGFYLNRDNRVWGNDQHDYPIILKRGYIPCIQLMVSAATAATIAVYNEDEEELGSSTSMTVEDMGTYVRLTYVGIQGQYTNDGHYSFVITTDVETYYSDVVAWINDTSDFLKIRVKSSDVALNPSIMAVQSYGSIVTSLAGGFIYEFYLSATENEDEDETQEKAEDLNGITNINYGTTSTVKSFDIFANRSLKKCLGRLRMLSVNGTVELTWKGEVTSSITDIEIEKKETYNSGSLYNLTLKYKDPWDAVMVINTIV